MDLERRATLILDHPETYPALEAWPESELVFRVWRYYALSVYSSWLLREKGGEFYVRRLEWDRSRDVGWPQADPTIYASESPVPAERAGSIVRGLRAVALPPFAEARGFGIDGVVYGVESRVFYLNASLSWWVKPPEGWEALAEWLDQTVTVLDGFLPESTARMRK